MVWPFTSSSNDDDSKRDPLRDLDPTLRQFLERESPGKYALPPPSTDKTAPSATTAKPTSPSSAEDASHTNSSSNGAESPLPANTPTLFKDGRYAHLWTTYRPLAEVEDANTSPQDKLADILTGYRDRKSNIGKAALENCAIEQFNLNDCYRNGDIGERFLNCRSYMKKLDRCYTMNQRLLRALGYLGAYDRPPEVEEKIQMHADKLYQTMIAQENGDSQGRAADANSEVSEGTTKASDAQSELRLAERRIRAHYDRELDPSVLKSIEELRPKVREKYKDRLAKLKPDEQPLEERALAMEWITGKDVVKTVDTLREQNTEQREERLKKGEGSIRDRVSKLIGW